MDIRFFTVTASHHERSEVGERKHQWIWEHLTKIALKKLQTSLFYSVLKATFYKNATRRRNKVLSIELLYKHTHKVFTFSNRGHTGCAENSITETCHRHLQARFYSEIRLSPPFELEKTVFFWSKSNGGTRPGLHRDQKNIRSISNTAP